MAVNLDIKVDPTQAEKALKGIGQAGEQAGEQIEKSFDEAGKSGSKLADSTRDSSAAMEIHALRIGEFTKSLGEGMSQAVEVMNSSGDLGDAAQKFTEKLGQGVSQFNPIIGISIQAASHIGKMVWDMSDFGKKSKEAAAEAKKVADETAKVKANTEAASKAMLEAAMSGAKLAGSITEGGDAADAAAAVAKQVEAIASTRRIMAQQMNKDMPEALRKEFEEQTKALDIEEARLKVQHQILNARHLELATTDTATIKNQKAMKETEDKMKDIHKGAMQSITQRMTRENDLAKDQKKTATEKADQDKKFEKDLQDLIEKTQKKIRDNQRAFKEDNKERQDAFKDLEEAENKLDEHRKQMHDTELARIKELEQKQIESLQRRMAAEIEMEQGIWRAKEQIEDQQKKKLEESKEFQGAKNALAAGTDDQRKLFEEFVKGEMKAAKEQAEADGKNGQQVNQEMARARKAAAERFKAYQRGQGEFAPVDQLDKDEINRKRQNGLDLTEDEKAKEERDNRRADVERGLGRARDSIVSRNRGAAERDINAQRGVTKEERELQIKALDEAERAARNQAQQGDEIGELTRRLKMLEKANNAIEEGARRRKGQQNSA